jgi:hypothetical protein
MLKMARFTIANSADISDDGLPAGLLAGMVEGD